MLLEASTASTTLVTVWLVLASELVPKVGLDRVESRKLAHAERAQMASRRDDGGRLIDGRAGCCLGRGPIFYRMGARVGLVRPTLEDGR